MAMARALPMLILATSLLALIAPGTTDAGPDPPERDGFGALALPWPAGARLALPTWSEYPPRDADGDRVDDMLAWMDGDVLPVLVHFDRWPTPSDVASLERSGATPRYVSYSVPVVSARVGRGQVASLARLAGVRWVEADLPIATCLDTSVPAVGIDTARETYRVDGRGATIAIIDTGIDAGHQGLDDLDDDPATDDPKVVAFYDAASDFDNTGDLSNPYDLDGHGTHVAGIAAGTGAPDGTYVGVAPGATLVGVRII